MGDGMAARAAANLGEGPNVHSHIKQHVFEHRLNELETNLGKLDLSGFQKTLSNTLETQKEVTTLKDLYSSPTSRLN
jgi:hypothetical protein